MILPIGDVYNRPGSARVATWTLLILNVAVYLYEVILWSLGGDSALIDFFMKYGAVPAIVTLPPGENTVKGLAPMVMQNEYGQIYTTLTQQVIHVTGPHWLGLVTGLFIHANFVHIAGNMLFFWIFADNVEDLLGTVGFLVLYFTSGIMAMAAQVAIHPDSLVPCIGASGAIAGVLGAYLIFFPWNRVKIFYWFFFFFFGIWEVSALFVLSLWFVLQLLMQMATSEMVASGGVAYMAHVGGFLTGIVLGAVLPKRPHVKAYYARLFGGA
jgi:membrane associated rhomboid family serine protease